VFHWPASPDCALPSSTPEHVRAENAFFMREAVCHLGWSIDVLPSRLWRVLRFYWAFCRSPVDSECSTVRGVSAGLFVPDPTTPRASHRSGLLP